MPGLNASLNIALSGLQANQSALGTVGHNIANINTPNYSRQRPTLSSNGAQLFGNVEFGTGVSLTAVAGARDRFLEMQLIQSTCRKSGSDVRFAGVEGVSSLFMDSGEASLNTLCQRFFQSFQELQARPEDMAVRTNVVGRAKSLVEGMQSRYQVLTDQRTQADRSIGSIVQEVNTLTTEIAKLNGRIATEISAGMESDARDQRQTLATKLGKLVGIQVFEDNKGQMQITVDGGSAVLVNGSTALSLRATPDAALGNLLKVEVVSGNGGAAIDVTKGISEGALGANLDLRDRILPGFQRNLDQLTAGIASQANAAHKTGFDMNGVAGQDFFQSGVANGANGLPPSVIPGNNYQGMVFAMSVNAAIAKDPKLIAGSSVAGAVGNSTIAKALADLQTKANSVDTNGDGVGDTGPFGTYVASIANQMGNAAQSLQTRSTNDENLLVALQNQRDRISGVDLDEEATQMMSFQRGYQASAHFVSIINQLTDQLVNNFGK